MSLLFRSGSERRAQAQANPARTEQRALTQVPWNIGEPWTSTNGQISAMSLAPVYAAVRVLSDSLSTLPVKPYRKDGDQRIPMPSPPALLANLQSAGNQVTWLAQAVASLALRGNAVGLKANWDGFGFPGTVTWLSMSDIWVDDSGYPDSHWYWKGRPIDPANLLWIPWVTVPGRTLGLSPIEVYALTINAGLKAQAFGSQWFDNGGVPPGTFRNEAQTITEEQAETIGQRLVRAIRKGRPLVYGKDWAYTPLSIPPEQAQFIESQKLTATQIAAIYGIDPTWIGGESGNSLTYANVEQRALEFTTFGLRPWVIRFEHAINAIIPERQTVSLNLDALVRADILTRHRVYQIDRTIGLRNIDEERALEDLPPLPNGEGKDYTPLAKVTLAETPRPDPLASEDPLSPTPDGADPTAPTQAPPGKSGRLAVVRKAPNQ